MNISVLTLFPEWILQGVNISVVGRAIQNELLTVSAINIRDFSYDKHKRVDDYPYGGGAGMVMQAAPIYRAYQTLMDKIQSTKSKVKMIYCTPQGDPFDQKMAEKYSKEEELIFLCGHYEGIDERVLEMIEMDWVSIGDYVLTGGELPALVMIDSIARLIPGVLHNQDSANQESFQGSLLEYPHYTRPQSFQGKTVPDVLLSGHHEKIENWRREQSVLRTFERRKRLLDQADLSEKEKEQIAQWESEKGL
ncbi:tRNA (guanine-N(1)-)-methyltransferase [Clostridia bacterium]|nr:tRNA (guanine-N(1)-)-methyltransferase [Clostridia bacterium]